MSDEQVVEPSETGTQGAEAEQGGVNPAWSGIESKLPAEFFQVIKPELENFDKQAKDRITSVNQQYSWAKDLDSNQVSQAMNIMRSIDENPEQIYDALGKFLRDNGRMPETPAEVQQVQDDAEEADPNAQRLDSIEQQNQQLMQLMQQQEEQRVQAQADEELVGEVSALQQAHPDLQQEDLREIIQRAAFHANQTGQVPSLESMYQEFSQLRDRILGAQRPGAAAPRLIPTGGGVPNNQPTQKTLGQLSNGQTQDLVTALLKQGG